MPAPGHGPRLRQRLHPVARLPVPRLGLPARRRAAPRAGRARLPRTRQEHPGPGTGRAEERRGVVFVTQEGSASGELDGLPDLLGDGPALLRTEELVLDVNWKLFTETFLEGYHIRTTHPDTFYPYGYDNLTVIEPFGRRNTRVTFPFRRIERLRDVPAPERRINGELISVYHLFPNGVVGRFTHHSVLMVLDPLEVGRTLHDDLRDEQPRPPETP